MSVAFFDMDLTLLSENTGTLWMKRELREGQISRVTALRGAWAITRYQLGLAGVEQALLWAIASLEGQQEAQLRDRTLQFYEEEVQGLYRPGGLEALARHRASGDKLVLLTGSSNYLSAPVQRALGLDDVLCNRFEVDAAGRFTGRPQGTVCYGQGKLEHAQLYASMHGLPLSDCTFYTDSHSDLPAMQAMGEPVAVNPDPRLRREARRRGWRVVDWGTP